MSKPEKTTAFKHTALIIYGLTVACGSFLMLCVEPFVAQLLLPVLGGGPNVWTSCMLFFQVILLAGYIYAHLISTRLSLRIQIVLHILVVWLPLGCLPVQRPFALPVEVHPFFCAFYWLATMIGALFFAVSATAPLIQKWYSKIDASDSADPYFLYAMSNLGGVLGLVCYSLVVAPNLDLHEQSKILTIFYASFAAAITICGAFLLFNTKEARVASDGLPSTTSSENVQNVLSLDGVETSSVLETGSVDATTSVKETPLDEAAVVDLAGVKPIHTGQILNWLVMSIIPSSLVLGLTTYVTSEVSSFPLFWAVPLLLYLMSFIIAFGRCPIFVLKCFRALAPLAVVLVMCLMVSKIFSSAGYGGDERVTVGISLHLLALFLVCVACHGTIAIERPSTKHLTFYYLVISVGGVIGSLLNNLLAPLLFKSSEEYPLMLMAAAIVLSQLPRVGIPVLARFGQWLDLKLSKMDGKQSLITLMVPAVVLLISSIPWLWYESNSHATGGHGLMMETILELSILIVLPFVCCLLLSQTVLQYRLGLAVMCLFSFYSYIEADPSIIHRERNFFGTVSVRINKDLNACELWNGVTVHGLESLDPAKRDLPLLYLAPDGPVGQIVQDLFAENSSPSTPPETPSQNYLERFNIPKKILPGPIGVIGIGCGTAAYLAKPQQSITFYEINPQVIEIANNPFYFSYFFLARKRGVDLKIVSGDGRLGIQKAPYNHFKLILSDAYSGSSIPTHLITMEAIRTYLQKLTPDGVLVFNINNEYYKLWPVFANVAPQLGAQALLVREYYGSKDLYTEWVFITRNKKVLDQLKDKAEKVPPLDGKFRIWTDDFSNPLALFSPDFS